ncbi:hypothetical protein ABZ930_01505 [Streptomyces sp. NPDC046716]|uniref:hypothetical protein n=1 Tax=Streptomyces sp. NPDC046716 TaxID=3157093 RepID=UPI0033C1EEEA
MGVDVVLVEVEQRGTSSKKRRLTSVASVQDRGDLFSALCATSSLPMLNRVDPYRSQILTSVEMPQFLSEIDVTRDLVKEQRERDVLEKVRELAERCAEATTLELHLEGD